MQRLQSRLPIGPEGIVDWHCADPTGTEEGCPRHLKECASCHWGLVVCHCTLVCMPCSPTCTRAKQCVASGGPDRPSACSRGRLVAQSRKTPGGHPVAMQSQRWAAQVSTTGSAGAPAALFDRPPVQSSRDPGRPEHQGLLVGESSRDLGLTRAAGDPGWTRAAGTPCCQ